MSSNQLHTPPKWASKWIQSLIEPDTAEYLLGDLEEYFEDDLENFGPFRAKWNYSMGAIGLTRLAFLRRKKTSQLFIPTGMYKNYIKIAWRNIVKQRMYSFINISGLAVGLAVFLVILIYVTDELRYNEFNSNK